LEIIDLCIKKVVFFYLKLVEFGNLKSKSCLVIFVIYFWHVVYILCNNMKFILDLHIYDIHASIKHKYWKLNKLITCIREIMVCGIYFLPPKLLMYWKIFNHEAFVVHIITIGKKQPTLYDYSCMCFMFEPFSLYKLAFFTIVDNSWREGGIFPWLLLHVCMFNILSFDFKG
jgi:hypothetical protein